MKSDCISLIRGKRYWARDGFPSCLVYTARLWRYMRTVRGLCYCCFYSYGKRSSSRGKNKNKIIKKKPANYNPNTTRLWRHTRTVQSLACCFLYSILTAKEEVQGQKKKRKVMEKKPLITTLTKEMQKNGQKRCQFREGS